MCEWLPGSFTAKYTNKSTDLRVIACQCAESPVSRPLMFAAFFIGKKIVVQGASKKLFQTSAKYKFTFSRALIILYTQ